MLCIIGRHYNGIANGKTIRPIVKRFRKTLAVFYMDKPLNCVTGVQWTGYAAGASSLPRSDPVSRKWGAFETIRHQVNSAPTQNKANPTLTLTKLTPIQSLTGWLMIVIRPG